MVTQVWVDIGIAENVITDRSCHLILFKQYVNFFLFWESLKIIF